MLLVNNQLTKFLKRGIVIYSSFFLCIIFSCNSNRVEIGKNKFYNKDDEEVNSPLTSYVKSEYKFFVENLSIELPLNRHLKSKNTSVYVGISIAENIDKVNDHILKDTSAILITKKNINQTKVYFFKKQNIFYQIFAIQDDFPIIIIASGKDSTIIKSSYNENKIISKIY